MSIFNITGKRVMVTGGAGQLGQQWCSALRAAGAEPFIVDLPEYDVRSPEDMERAVTACGSPDAAVLAAAIDAKPGTPGCGKPEDVPLNDFAKAIGVNLIGVQNCLQVFGSAMKQRRHGSIVVISSLFGLGAPDHRRYEGLPKPFFKPSAYSASKAGVLGLMRYWAAYLAPYNVRVNALVPGSMDRKDYHPSFREAFTHDVPMGRFAQPGEFNGAILYLVSEASSYQTGSVVTVDGGYSAW